LTEDWRDKQEVLGQGADLLKQLLKDRQSFWERERLEAFRREGKAPADNRWKLHYRPPAPIEDDDLPDIPNAWVWASVESISTKVVDGVHKTPNYVAEGVPFVTVRNLTAGPGISFDELNYITKEDHLKFMQRAHPEKGDILVSKDGTLGVVRAVRTDRPLSIYVTVALIKPTSQKMTDYLDIALSSSQVQKQMVGTGSGLQHIHLRDLRADCVPLPSLQEQHEIVRRVGALFKLADAIEKRVEVATRRAEKLTQAILAKAFRGELVPTEAELARREGRDYEPASVLLERLRTERTASDERAPSHRGHQRSRKIRK
jgi:type I restriction enzyme S subunit